MNRPRFIAVTAAIMILLAGPPYLFGLISGREALIAAVYAMAAIGIYDSLIGFSMRALFKDNPDVKQAMKRAIRKY